jgi:hypothetical protein
MGRNSIGERQKLPSHSTLLRPYSVISSQLSAPAITAQTAITRISINRCSTLPPQRGSSRVENSSANFLTRHDPSCQLIAETRANKATPTVSQVT